VIVTVTLNPALHVEYTAQRVCLGAANLVTRVSYQAGGAGLAVARVLHRFGHEVVAAGLAGGAAGELIRAGLSRSGIATQFTPIAMESRRAVRVADTSAGQLTTFDEPAPYITTEELGRLARDYRGLMDGATAAVLCGSLPAGLPPEIYASLASYAAEAGVPAILDACGSALWHAVSRRPALVIPGPSAADLADLVAGGAQAAAAESGGIIQVVTEAGRWRAWLPASAAHGGTGPRWPHDALVAGFVPGIALGWSWADTLRHAVALAAAAPPAGEVDLGKYEALLPDVEVEPPPAD
jgi:tagatose 6-phosphate kinase